MGTFNYYTDDYFKNWFNVSCFCHDEDEFRQYNEDGEVVDFLQDECDDFVSEIKEKVKKFNENNLFNVYIEYGYYEGMQIMFDVEKSNEKIEFTDWDLSEKVWEIINEKYNFNETMRQLLKLNYIYGDKQFEDSWGSKTTIMDIVKNFLSLKKFLIELQEYGFRCRTNGWVTHELPLIA